jgi:hypothetical protein
MEMRLCMTIDSILTLKPKLSDPACERALLQPERDGRVGWGAIGQALRLCSRRP